MNVCSFRISVRLIALEVGGKYLIKGIFCLSFRFNVVLICENGATDLFFSRVGFKFSQSKFLAETVNQVIVKSARYVLFLYFRCFTVLCLVLRWLWSDIYFRSMFADNWWFNYVDDLFSPYNSLGIVFLRYCVTSRESLGPSWLFALIPFPIGCSLYTFSTIVYFLPCWLMLILMAPNDSSLRLSTSPRESTTAAWSGRLQVWAGVG